MGMDAIAAIDRAFGPVPKPGHFTNYSHCQECAEHDDLLRNRDRGTLSLQDLSNAGSDPFCFCSAEGMAFYMPSLVRLALATPVAGHDWYGDRLLFRLYSGATENPLYKYCSESQRAAVATLLHELIVNHADTIDAYQSSDEFLRAYDIWSGRGADPTRET